LEAKVPENRDIVITRKYDKAGEKFRSVMVSQVSGDNIEGTVFRFEVWAIDQELKDKRVDSGNKYTVRKIFIETLMDMQEDGWKRMGSSTSAHPEEKFFDPQYL